MAVAVIGLGLAGTVLPVLPGPVLVFAGMAIAAWADGFTRIGLFPLALLAALGALAYVADFAAGALGARRFGASRRAVWGAVAGTVVGLFFGLPGVIVGPFVGAVAAEYTVRRRLGEASRVGLGTWVGLVVATAARVALVFAMLGVFAVALAV